MPSGGYLPFQQAYYQVTKEGEYDVNISKTELNKPQMFNGSAKLFWEAPNYGWFDTTQIKKPSYDEHLKFIQPNDAKAQQFEFIFSSANNWKIEDLMGVFDYEQLNSFEQEFLEFSKEHGTSKIFVETDNIDTTYTSFREILKEIFIIDKIGRAHV